MPGVQVFGVLRFVRESGYDAPSNGRHTVTVDAAGQALTLFETERL